MATALAAGFIRTGLAAKTGVLAADPSQPAREHFAEQTGAQASATNLDVAKFGSVIFLAVKPDQVNSVLAEVRDVFSAKQLLVSIAAGVPLARMESALGPDRRVVRVMPNTPALLGASASAYALGKAATAEDGALVYKFLSAVGIAVRVKESLLDAVTGLSGSGPAYIYMVIEALSDGGVAAGLPRDIATRLAAQTVLGSARMVLETGMHPGALKDMVTSPGGTTIEGVHELEKGKLRSTLINAVRAATEKAKHLGQA